MFYSSKVHKIIWDYTWWDLCLILSSCISSRDFGRANFWKHNIESSCHKSRFTCGHIVNSKSTSICTTCDHPHSKYLFHLLYTDQLPKVWSIKSKNSQITSGHFLFNLVLKRSYDYDSYIDQCRTIVPQRSPWELWVTDEAEFLQPHTFFLHPTSN